MPKEQSWKTSQGLYKPKTEQHTYRFNAELWAEFEADCDLNLRNVRLVVEALARYWLDAGPKTREFIARHQRKSAAAETMPKQDSPSISTAPATVVTQSNSADANPFEDQDFVDV
jgi:hypothetical protein